MWLGFPFCIALLVVLLADIVEAVCSNECSGHGSCGLYDKCYCFKAPDGKAAWTGHDCSLRTCPS